MTADLPLTDPLSLMNYLRSRGWAREGSRNGADIWSLQRADAAVRPMRLLVPSERVYPDDDLLLHEAIHRLATWESRDVEDITLDLVNAGSATQVFRTMPSTESGIIPLGTGTKSLQGIHTLWKISGRRAEEGPSPLYQKQASPSVIKLVNEVEMLPTRPGSYIFTTRLRPEAPSAIPRQPSIISPDMKPEPTHGLTRSTMLTALREELRQAHGVAALLADGGQIRDHSERGVSADTCKALADLGGDRRRSPVEITLTEPFDGSEPNEPERLEFTGPMIREIFDFGTQLENLARTGPGEIEGTVEILDRHQRVKIAGRYRTDGNWKAGTLWVVVSDDGYRRATGAHSSGKLVRAVGEIVVTNRRVELHTDSAGLEVLGS